MVSMERKSTGDSNPELSDIRSTWNIVRPGLEKILEENPNLTFIPEDVYSECVNEKAFLFTSPECKFIEAQSNVPELEPYAVERGWSLDTRIYRRTVSE